MIEYKPAVCNISSWRILENEQILRSCDIDILINNINVEVDDKSVYKLASSCFINVSRTTSAESKSNGLPFYVNSVS